MNDTAEKFESWAVVEIFGHQRYAGFVGEQSIGGSSFVRLDVPEVPERNGSPAVPAFTKLFGQGAIYSITPCSEELARAAAGRLRSEPVTIYMPELHPPREEAPRALPEYEDDDDYDPRG